MASNALARVHFGDMPKGTPLFLKLRLPEARIAFEKTIKTSAPAHFDYHERVPLERWFRVDISPIMDKGGHPNACLFLFQDSSKLHLLESMRTDFVANASHELRTPLAVLSGFIDTLMGSARNDEKARNHFLSIMQTQAARMKRLIDDLLSLSQLEARPKADLSYQVSLPLIAKEVIDFLKPLAHNNNVELTLQYNDSNLIVYGVKDELIQLLENLIENACKYGRLGKKVIVKMTREGDLVQLSVQDFGAGIAQEHLPRLTERFYRINHEPSQKGTGLGLSIVKHIVTRHQARLTIVSKLGEGTTFVVTFNNKIIT
jgi:two-component system, OmpR family, phosphate regulon sensor histidine kinase PhoR